MAYYQQKSAPPVEEEGQILVIQADGKGVPMVRETSAPAKVRLGKGEKRTKKKESIVTTLYTIEPNLRTPEEVVASVFHKDGKAKGQKEPNDRVRPIHKHVWATLAGKDAALQPLPEEVALASNSTRSGKIIRFDFAHAQRSTSRPLVSDRLAA